MTDTMKTKARSKPVKAWSKPVLAPLGKIADVSGPGGIGTEGGPNGKS